MHLAVQDCCNLNLRYISEPGLRIERGDFRRRGGRGRNGVGVPVKHITDHLDLGLGVGDFLRRGELSAAAAEEEGHFAGEVCGGGALRKVLYEIGVLAFL